MGQRAGSVEGEAEQAVIGEHEAAFEGAPVSRATRSSRMFEGVGESATDTWDGTQSICRAV